jgi:oxygen-independent coproporphyrinogen-3 oxidase
MTTDPAGLYVHVPFCVRKCPYCAFASGTDRSLVPAYLDALEGEIGSRADPDLACDTVHFGGGTPSLLGPAEAGRILRTLTHAFRVADGAEITLEANPGTVTAETLRGFREAGINRIVLGAQSFSERDLAFLGRIHGPGDIRAAHDAAREAGFENLGLDLIYGLPGRSFSHWSDRLDEAIALGPAHLSCYALTLEEGTPFAERRERGALLPPGEEEAREHFLGTLRHLGERGYPFYEVSNFSRRGLHPSRHNAKYWIHTSVLGFGPSAHSFRAPEREWNVQSVEAYIEAVAGGRSPRAGGETLRPAQQAMERMALGLRTGSGVELERLEEDLAPGFRRANAEVIDGLLKEGLARREGERLLLTPEGLVVVDRVATLFEFSARGL